MPMKDFFAWTTSPSGIVTVVLVTLRDGPREKDKRLRGID